MITLRAGKEIDQFGELAFKPGSWEKAGLPERGCRVRNANLASFLQSGGTFTADHAIHGLMDWLDVTDEPEPALELLRRLLARHYPPDGQTKGTCRFQNEHGEVHSFHAGPVDIDQRLVAWQREDWIIALGQAAPAETGRILIGSRAPISLDVARRILSVSMLSYMNSRYDSFAGARSAASGTAAFYLWHARKVTPTRWDDGLSGDARNSFLDGGTSWLSPNQLVVQVAIATGY